MNDTTWLMLAGMAVWLILGGYLALLGTKTASLAARLRRLEHAARPDRSPARNKGI